MTSLTGIHHVALTVSDAERSAAWYRALLGLTEVLRGDDDTVSFRVLAGGPIALGVRQYHQRPSDGFDELRTGLDHLAFGVGSREELEGWQELLRDRSIPFTPIADTSIGSVIVFRDPDNIQLEIWLPAGS